MALSRPYKRRLSTPLGTSLEMSGILLGLLLLDLARLFHSTIGILLLFASWLCFLYFSHCLAHFIVGRALGIRFRFYFFGKSNLLRLKLPSAFSYFMKHFPMLGIKIEDESFKDVKPRRKALMFASGALASMFTPLITLIYALLYLPTWMAIVISVLTATNIILGSYCSLKVGDFRKAILALKSSDCITQL